MEFWKKWTLNWVVFTRSISKGEMDNFILPYVWPSSHGTQNKYVYILKSKGTFWKSQCGLGGGKNICAFRPIFIFACLIHFKHVSEGSILKSFISKSHYFLFKFWHVLHTCTMRVTACESLVQERTSSKKIK